MCFKENLWCFNKNSIFSHSNTVRKKNIVVDFTFFSVSFLLFFHLELYTSFFPYSSTTQKNKIKILPSILFQRYVNFLFNTFFYYFFFLLCTTILASFPFVFIYNVQQKKKTEKQRS